MIYEKGYFDVVCRNPDGSVAWEERIFNAATTVGLNDLLNTYFDAATTKHNTWYLGLVDNAGFSAFAATDTMSSHAGWTESVAYSESARPTWTPSAAAGGSISGTASVAFTITGSPTIKGVFITTSSTKSGTTGTLFATAAFSLAQVPAVGQTLEVAFTCPLTPG